MSMLLLQFTSCNNNEQDNLSLKTSNQKILLKQYGDIHNSSLDFIVSDAKISDAIYSKERIETVYDKWLINHYDKDNASAILQKIDTDKKLVLDGHLPNQKFITRSYRWKEFTNQANPFTQDALNVCLDKISNRLKGVNNDEVFNNKSLLADLHTIINETYTVYAKKCSSDVDAKALVETLGVLYGSIEYWTNPINVEAWSKIYLEDDEPFISTHSKGIKKEGQNYDYKLDKKNNGGKKKKKKEKLSKAEWVMVVGAADAGGSAIGTPALGGICSAAAALYFDVE